MGVDVPDLGILGTKAPCVNEHKHVMTSVRQLLPQCLESAVMDLLCVIQTRRVVRDFPRPLIAPETNNKEHQERRTDARQDEPNRPSKDGR